MSMLIDGVRLKVTVGNEILAFHVARSKTAFKRGGIYLMVLSVFGPIFALLSERAKKLLLLLDSMHYNLRFTHYVFCKYSD